jgi:hypothetical protein
MSDNNLPEIEHQGFPSALFLNMSEFYPNCKTPKRELSETIDSCRLSIESLTPRTTPKGSEKRVNDSNFKYCLSKDLLQKLEENSPFTNYPELNGKISDVCLLEEEGIEEDEEIEEKNDPFSNFSPNTFPSESSVYGYPYQNNCDAKYEHDKMIKVINLGHGEISNLSNLQGICYSGFNQRLFTSFGKRIGSGYNFNFNLNPSFFNNSATYSNKLNQLPLQNYSSNLLNYNNTSLNQINDQNVNMYGKCGWVCSFCKNFNFESNYILNFKLVRIKCNRCGKTKNEVTCKEAVIVNNNIKVNENQVPSTSTINNTNSQKKKKPFVERVGDWNCFKCKNLNFSFRVVCNRCQLSKKDSEKLNENISKTHSVTSNVPKQAILNNFSNITETSVNSC